MRRCRLLQSANFNPLAAVSSCKALIAVTLEKKEERMARAFCAWRQLRRRRLLLGYSADSGVSTGSHRLPILTSTDKGAASCAFAAGTDAIASVAGV